MAKPAESTSLKVQELLKLSLTALNTKKDTKLHNGQTTHGLAEKIESWFREMAMTGTEPKNSDTLMRDALYAFNELHNFNFAHTNSYSLAAELGRKIREFNVENDIKQHPGLEHIHPDNQQKQAYTP